MRGPAAAFAAAVLMAAASAATSAASGATPGLEARDLRYAAEYRNLVSARGSGAWPGWRSPAPLLQRKGSREFLIGHPSPPASFRRVPGLTVLGAAVFSAPAGTITPGPAATTWNVAGVQVAIIPVRAELERAVDAQLGRGAVPWSDSVYLRALVHEAFHAHALAVRRGRPPSFGSDMDEREALEALGALPAAEARLAREGAALRSAIGARTRAGARKAAAEFLRLLAERWAALGTGFAGFERELEWVEGSARYADYRLLLAAGSPGYVPAAKVAYPGAAAQRAALLAELADPAPRNDGLRGRWQVLGAGMGLVLDRLLPGWHARALSGGEALDVLLAEAVDVPQAFAHLRAARVIVGGRPMRVALAERSEQWSKGLGGVKGVAPLDGMLFVFPRESDGAFWMKDTLIPLDIAFFDAKGTLVSVRTMPLCTVDACPTYVAGAPYKYALETPAGRLAGLPAGARLDAPSLSGS